MTRSYISVQGWLISLFWFWRGLKTCVTQQLTLHQNTSTRNVQCHLEPPQPSATFLILWSPSMFFGGAFGWIQTTMDRTCALLHVRPLISFRVAIDKHIAVTDSHSLFHCTVAKKRPCISQLLSQCVHKTFIRQTAFVITSRNVYAIHIRPLTLLHSHSESLLGRHYVPSS
jgi:hypothetical protein